MVLSKADRAGGHRLDRLTWVDAVIVCILFSDSEQMLSFVKHAAGNQSLASLICNVAVVLPKIVLGPARHGLVGSIYTVGSKMSAAKMVISAGPFLCAEAHCWEALTYLRLGWGGAPQNGRPNLF